MKIIHNYKNKKDYKLSMLSLFFVNHDLYSLCAKSNTQHTLSRCLVFRNLYICVGSAWDGEPQNYSLSTAHIHTNN